MAPSRAQRLQLYEELVKEFGDEPAMTLMESLPPVDWHELATKDDLAALEERVNARFEVVDARFDALRTELGAKISELRGEMSVMNAKFEVVDARLDALRTEVRGEISKLGGEAKRDVARQTYVILAGLVAIITPIYIALFTGATG